MESTPVELTEINSEFSDTKSKEISADSSKATSRYTSTSMTASLLLLFMTTQDCLTDKVRVEFLEEPELQRPAPQIPPITPPMTHNVTMMQAKTMYLHFRFFANCIPCSGPSATWRVSK